MKQMQEQEENLVKSIIYGNLIQTSYGIMRALCSAISSKDHIDKIILFLRNNHNFQKYNKFIYSFRLQQQPNQNHLFITQDHNAPPPRFLEGYSDDTGLEGNGEKLLALLQKFNVRNVLVIVALRQKDSLREFNAEHYVQIIKCAKELLSSLYDKVILSKGDTPAVEVTPENEKTPLPAKEYLIPLEEHAKPEKPRDNPNYVGQHHVRRRAASTLKEQKEPQINFLNEKIKELASVLQEIIERFTENEDAQVRFAIKYDKNKRVVKVFRLLARLFDFDSKEDMLSQNMSTYLRSITTRNLTAATIRTLNEELMSDRSIRSENISKESKICGILMEFLEVLLRSYAFAKKLAMIESEIQDRSEEVSEEGGQEDDLMI